MLKFMLIMIFIVFCGVLGYGVQYARYCKRYYGKYGKKVFRRGLTFLSKL